MSENDHSATRDVIMDFGKLEEKVKQLEKNVNLMIQKNILQDVEISELKEHFHTCRECRITENSIALGELQDLRDMMRADIVRLNDVLREFSNIMENVVGDLHDAIRTDCLVPPERSPAFINKLGKASQELMLLHQKLEGEKHTEGKALGKRPETKHAQNIPSEPESGVDSKPSYTDCVGICGYCRERDVCIIKKEGEKEVRQDTRSSAGQGIPGNAPQPDSKPSFKKLQKTFHNRLIKKIVEDNEKPSEPYEYDDADMDKYRGNRKELIKWNEAMEPHREYAGSARQTEGALVLPDDEINIIMERIMDYVNPEHFEQIGLLLSNHAIFRDFISVRKEDLNKIMEEGCKRCYRADREYDCKICPFDIFEEKYLGEEK